MEDDCGKGTYVLVLYVARGRTLEVGKLGPVRFKRGPYAYVGSAFGPGGLKSRIRHHLAPKTKFHWHLDYLDAPVREIWMSAPGARQEHAWAAALEEHSSGRIPGFGCSDCSCHSHLFHFTSLKILHKARTVLGRDIRARIAGPDFLSEFTQMARGHNECLKYNGF